MFKDDIAIEFVNVTKKYIINNAFQQGIKGFILNMLKPSYHRSNIYTAITDMNFCVKKGESFGLIGKNGAGKSTTLGLIARVLYPTVGKITVNGRVAPLLELGAGFHTDLTGRENAMINGVLLGLTIDEVKEKMDKIINFSGLGHFIDLPVRTYSTGMLVRLGFSVAINTNPDILLVDEVLAVGDAEFQEKCINAMQNFKKQGVTIVFVSHALKAAEIICDRIAYIDNHKIIGIGTPHEMMEIYMKEHGNYSSNKEDKRDA
ncbi:ABC transporter ATP-binding protein [Pectinatus haikarae]|uniref:Lipopolysaccharide transport system ATP-binding protein n=1 Tax=Pectinatus haikarae TaxID=349096 RepID=A0ABT9YBJ5_9FIRM|nr:ABC transporter ATP-binding protein [Pectinatus haikarae]MDQ0205187.1 lipopolysaccharide transport system ATP-binding protein [Pectinatus haikarae]